MEHDRAAGTESTTVQLFRLARVFVLGAGQRPGGLTVAAPERVATMTARRAALNEIFRGHMSWPAQRPLPVGVAPGRPLTGTSTRKPVG